MSNMEGRTDSGVLWFYLGDFSNKLKETPLPSAYTFVPQATHNLDKKWTVSKAQNPVRPSILLGSIAGTEDEYTSFAKIYAVLLKAHMGTFEII